MTDKKPTQEERILKALIEANGAFINGQYFLKEMMLSQYHRALWNLIHKRERYNYEGQIEVSDFTDDYKFKSYRLIAPTSPDLPFTDDLELKRDKVALQEPLFNTNRFYQV